MIPVVRTDIAPGVTGSWEDVDVTAHLGDDAGDVAGVMLEIIFDDVTAYKAGVRKNGSSDDANIYAAAGSSWHYWVAVGIDANDIFECKIENATTHIYLVAYIKNSEGSFFENYIEKSPGSTGWQDVNISGDTGDDTAVCAFVRLRNTATSWFNAGLRKNGSSDDRYQTILSNGGILGGMMSVDESEIFEVYRQTALIHVFLDGYLTDNFGDWANAKDYQTGTTGTWEDVDMSGDIPAGNDGAFMQFIGPYVTGGIRKNGTSIDNYNNFRINWPWVEIDSGRIAEQKINAVSCDLFLWGYTSQPEAPPPAVKAIVQAALISIPPLIALPTLSQIIKITGG